MSRREAALGDDVLARRVEAAADRAYWRCVDELDPPPPENWWAAEGGMDALRIGIEEYARELREVGQPMVACDLHGEVNDTPDGDTICEWAGEWDDLGPCVIRRGYFIPADALAGEDDQ